MTRAKSVKQQPSEGADKGQSQTKRKGRRATGAAGYRPGRIVRSVPTYPGCKTQTERAFDDDDWADSWYRDCWIALKTRPFPGLPDADDYRPGGRLRQGGDLAAAPYVQPPDFCDAADEWYRLTYEENRRSSQTQARKAREALPSIKSFFGPGGLNLGRIDRATGAHVESWIHHMAGDDFLPPNDISIDPVFVGPGPLGSFPEFLTDSEAAAFSGRTKSAVRGARHRGRFPGAKRADGPHGPATGPWLIPTLELVAAGFRSPDSPPVVPRGGHLMPRGTGLSFRTANAHLSVLRAIFDYCISMNYMQHNPTQGKRALTPAPALARKRPNKKKPVVITLPQTKLVAVGLPVATMVALWLWRILGLRIGESLGIHVGDIADFGYCGLIEIVRQGGSMFHDRDEYLRDIVVEEKETAKTEAGNRVLVVPEPLLELIRWYVDTAHRDPDTGEVDWDAPLIKGINGRSARKSTIAGHVRKRHAELGFTYDLQGFYSSAHSYRHAFGGDLTHDELATPEVKAQMLGHRLRSTGLAPDVTYRYTPDNPSLRPKLEVAEKLAAKIREEIGSLVPDEMQRPISGREPTVKGYTFVEASRQLGISITTLYNWVAKGRLTATWDPALNGGKGGRVITSYSLLACEEWLRNMLTPAMAGEALGIPTEEVLRLIRNGRLKAERAFGNNRYQVDMEDLRRIQVEFDARRDLRRRSMTLYRAAQTLGCSRSTVRSMIEAELLILDPDTSRPGVRWVTRASVQQVLEARSERQTKRLGSRRRSREGLITQSEAHQRFGLRPGEVADAIAAGLIRRSDIGGRRYLELDSVESYIEKWQGNALLG